MIYDLDIGIRTKRESYADTAESVQLLSFDESVPPSFRFNFQRAFTMSNEGSDTDYSIHGNQINEIHDIPLGKCAALTYLTNSLIRCWLDVIIRPIPSELHCKKVESLMETLKVYTFAQLLKLIIDLVFDL